MLMEAVIKAATPKTVVVMVSLQALGAYGLEKANGTDSLNSRGTVREDVTGGIIEMTYEYEADPMA
jgi:hypothetical protein